jgi:hypothetical protein
LNVMRLALVVLFVMATASAQTPPPKQYQTGFCPKTAELEAGPRAEYWFEGVLGKKHVRMYLNRGGAGVVGVFYETESWVPVFLGGKWIAGQPGAVELTARTQRDFEIGEVKGQLNEGELVGAWTPKGEETGISFRFKAVAQPKCDGTEPWKSFHDSHWPITFSYPASWHVSATQDSITLTCPDASLMAYDEHEIRIWQGPEANNAASDVVQCGDKWIYGYGCKCGRNIDGCKEAVAAEQEGMTVLTADDRAWRVYCRDGGYVGLGKGSRRILTFGDAWVVIEAQGAPAELVVRMLATAKRRH